MKEGENDSFACVLTCTANKFSPVLTRQTGFLVYKYRCIFVLLFEWYLLQLDNDKKYVIEFH